jgi:dihydrofolate reductase
VFPVRKIFSFMGVSADGYHADADGGLAWQTFDQPFTDYSIEQLDEVDTLIFGRVTYEGMAAYWPTQAGEDFDAGIAARMNAISKIVVSRTLDRAGWANTRVVRDDVAVQLTGLKRQPGKDIAIFGSSALTAELLTLGLVDELRLMVNPVILGRGASLFAGAPTTFLGLVKTRRFDSGCLLLTYRPSGGDC